MADIPANYTIPGTGDYDVSNLEPGSEYVVALATSDPSTSEASILFPIGVGGAFVDVDDNTFFLSGPMSRRFVSPASSIRISVTAFADDIQVTIREVIRQVK